jgi:hypothetical protein
MDPELSRLLAQTVASLFSVTIQNYYVASHWSEPGTANIVDFRALVPFEVEGQENLMRIDIPFRTASELGPGLSDTRIFDLLTFEFPTGFWGVGPVFNLGINRGPGIDTVEAGPAATLMFTTIPKVSVGLLTQNVFSEHVAVSTLQPILVYQPSEAFTIGLGDLPLAYDWNRKQFAVVSVGFQAGVLIHAASQPIRLFVNPQFNTKSSTQLYQWTIATGVVLPLKPVGSKS